MNIPTQNTATRIGHLIPTQVGICLLLSAFFFPLSSLADTTFVSGAVSAEWTRDGNPYIVVDSTWVPEGERLTLTAGVEAFFNEGQGLYVFGTMNAEGRENDSVRIRVSEGVEHWKGIRSAEDCTFEFSYCSVACPDTLMILDSGCEIFIKNSDFMDCPHAIAAWDSQFRDVGWVVTILDSKLRNGINLSSRGGRITLERSYVEFREGNNRPYPGFFGDGTRYTFTDSIIRGCLLSPHGGLTTFDNCRFLAISDSNLISIDVIGRGGYLKNSYVQGHVGLGPTFGHSLICDSDTILGSINSFVCNPVITNCVVQKVQSRGLVLADAQVAVVKGSEFWGSATAEISTQCGSIAASLSAPLLHTY